MGHGIGSPGRRLEATEERDAGARGRLHGLSPGSKAVPDELHGVIARRHGKAFNRCGTPGLPVDEYRGPFGFGVNLKDGAHRLQGEPKGYREGSRGNVQVQLRGGEAGELHAK
jgi:hypothetical protein